MSPEEETRFEFRIDYTPEIVARAARRFWRRQIGWRGWLMVAGLWGAVALMLTIGGVLWWVVVLIALSVIVTMLLPLSALLLQRSARQGLDRLDPPTVEFIFDLRGWTFLSPLGSSRQPWETIGKVWRFDDLWLIFLGQRQYLALPTDQVPEGALALLEARVQAAGGQVQ